MRRMSLLVGGVRVVFAAIFCGLVSVSFAGVPHRWIFCGYLASALAVWGTIWASDASRLAAE